MRNFFSFSKKKAKTEEEKDVSKKKELSQEEEEMLEKLEKGIADENYNVSGEDAEEKHQYYTRENYLVHPKLGLVYTEKSVISRQRKAALYMVKKVGAHFLKGQSIMNVSLPVTIFQKMSLIKCVAMDFTYAPFFLKNAAKETDPLKRMKQLVAFKISSLNTMISQEKPFNPILGETYEGNVADFNIFCEQISHHPPIASVILKGDNLTLYGTYEYAAKTSPNSVKGKKKGNTHIVFNDEKRTHYELSHPILFISGMMFGKRCLSFLGNIQIVDHTNHLFAEIRFDPFHKGAFKKFFSWKKNKQRVDYFRGVISKNSEIFKLQTKKMLNSPDVLSNIEGYWIDYLKIDDETLWEINKFLPFELRDHPNPLKSDCRFRDDLKELINEDFEQAQIEKEKLENIQRRDRKLRAEAMKIKKKEEKKKNAK